MQFNVTVRQISVYRRYFSENNSCGYLQGGVITPFGAAHISPRLMFNQRGNTPEMDLHGSTFSHAKIPFKVIDRQVNNILAMFENRVTERMVENLIVIVDQYWESQNPFAFGSSAVNFAKNNLSLFQKNLPGVIRTPDIQITFHITVWRLKPTWPPRGFATEALKELLISAHKPFLNDRLITIVAANFNAD